MMHQSIKWGLGLGAGLLLALSASADTTIQGPIKFASPDFTVSGNRVSANPVTGVTSITAESGLYATPTNPITGVGNIGCLVSTVGQIGCVKPDGTTITVTEDGTISAVGGTGCTEDTGADGQVCNSTGGTGVAWGSRVIGAPGAADSDGSEATITGGAGTGGGNGAAVNITGGAPGVDGSRGGDINITGGPNVPSSGASGGWIYVTGGDGGPDTNEDGGGVIINGGTGTGRPGPIDLGTIGAPPTATGDGGNVSLFTGGGGDNHSSGTMYITTANQAIGDTGSIPLSTGEVATAGYSSGDISLLTGGSTATSNAVTGSIDLITGLVSHGSAAAASAENTGHINVWSAGYMQILSQYRQQELIFRDTTLTGYLPFGLSAVSGLLSDSGTSGAKSGTTPRTFLITGELYGPVVNASTDRNGGEMMVLGGGFYPPGGVTMTYNGNHTGNLTLGAGFSQDVTKVDYGNVVYKTAEADQSYQVVTTGGSATVATKSGTIILDGVSSTFTLTMPRAPQDGRILRVAAHGTISSLTVSAPGGATVLDAPASLSGAGIAFIYRASNTSWYRLN